MSLRPGMTGLIQRIRSMTKAQSDELTLVGNTHFSDEMLQALLDTSRQEHRAIELLACPSFEDGAYVYRDYVVPAHIPYAFETPDASSTWRAYNSSGVDFLPDTDYSLNAEAGRLRFAQDMAGAQVWLDCSTYNLHRVAAEIWRQKAAFAVEQVDWQADQHSFDAAAIYSHCIEMADLHQRLAGPALSKFSRGD